MRSRKFAGVLAIAALSLTACAESESSAEDSPLLQADATVLESAEHGPQLCLGAVLTSLPPQCGGPPIIGWSWDLVGDEESVGNTTWGAWHVTGTYDGSGFTLRDVSETDGAHGDVDPPPLPCPEPDGGWQVDGQGQGDATFGAVERDLEDLDAFAGLWVYPIGGAARTEEEATGQRYVLVVAFTADPDTFEPRIRRRWRGPLCLTQHPRSIDDLRRIQREFRDEVFDQLDLKPLAFGVDVAGNVFSATVVYLDDATRREVARRYGEAVRLDSRLTPVSG